MIKKEQALLSLFYLLLVLILLIFVASYATVFRIRAVTGDEQLAFQENVFGESVSINRVVFALGKLFAYSHNLEDHPEDQELFDAKRAELSRSVLGHASIPSGVNEQMLSYLLLDDPLLLLDRNKISERAYGEEVEKLSRLYARLLYADSAHSSTALLEEFHDETLHFLKILEERSHLLTQIEDSYYSHLKKLVARQAENLNRFLVLQTILSVALGLVIYLFYYNQAKTQKQLILHRNHLSELVKDKTAELSRNNMELRQALENVKVLSGFLPICASCKKIRDDEGYWQRVEQYIGAHSEVVFSHGICPECAEKLYPDFIDAK